MLSGRVVGSGQQIVNVVPEYFAAHTASVHRPHPDGDLFTPTEYDWKCDKRC